MSKILGALLVAITLTLSVTTVAAGQAPQSRSTAEDLAIVVNPETPVTKLTFAELRQVFLGDKQYWSADMPVVLLIRAPTSVERDAVLNTIYQMQEAQFKQYWIAKIFRADLSSPPKIVYSNDAANVLVENVPGAIAFIPAKDVKPGLKVLRVDDRLPGEPGYRLHLTAK
jgi:ABC-type phosphate transport system substrate-binding protein